jgi:hypothetical protein
MIWALAPEVRERRASRDLALFRAYLLVLLLPLVARADDIAACIPFDQAAKHVGQKHCVTGRVLHVKQTQNATFLDFCTDYRVCPFTVVAFRGDLRRIGDLRHLAGQIVQIEGKIEDYEGRAEIQLENVRQLLGAAGKLPPLPKAYDVTQRGHASAGDYTLPRSKRRPSRKRQPDISAEDPTQPE